MICIPIFAVKVEPLMFFSLQISSPSAESLGFQFKSLVVFVAALLSFKKLTTQSSLFGSEWNEFNERQKINNVKFTVQFTAFALIRMFFKF